MTKFQLLILFFGLSVLIIVGSGLFFYPLNFSLADTVSEFKAGEFLVKFKNDDQVYKIKSSADLDIWEVISNYQNIFEVEYIEPNYILEATAFPNDPDYRFQDYLTTVNARNAWSKELLIREQERITRQSVIAVLDTGVDIDHPDLKDKIWVNPGETAGNNLDDDGNGYTDDINGWDFVDLDSDPNPALVGNYDEDAVKHGTIVAGIAAAVTNNQQGISGISWFSQIMPLRVLDSQGVGDVFSVIQAIDYAIEKEVAVINMSFVGSGFSQSLNSAIRRAFNADILLVAAAGNTDPKVNGVDLDVRKAYPVCYDGGAGENLVIGVASVDGNLQKSSFSNYGSCIDIVAPGEDFYSTQFYQPGSASFIKPYNGYWSGTSLSVPLVSGTLASIKALRPNFSAAEIRDLVLDSTQDIYNYNPTYQAKLGSGLLDFAKALEAALGHRVPKAKGGQDNYIVVGLGLGSFPQIKILRTDGSVFKEFYAYSPFFTGPINIAAGDINGDGKDEIITGAGVGGGPHVRVFNIEGQLLSQFFAYDESFRGGVNVAVGDIDGDGVAEIITGSGKGGRPQVKVFGLRGNLINQFIAYGEDFFGGVKVGVGDFTQDGKADIVTGAGTGGGPHVRVFQADGRLISQFFAYNKNFKGGVNVAAGDITGDGVAEIIVSIERDSVPTVRVFTHRGVQLLNFFAYSPNFFEGVYVATGDIDNDGVAEIITGAGIGGQAQAKVFDRQGNLNFELLTHFKNYRGGVRPAVIRN